MVEGGPAGIQDPVLSEAWHLGGEADEATLLHAGHMFRTGAVDTVPCGNEQRPPR